MRMPFWKNTELGYQLTESQGSYLRLDPKVNGHLSIKTPSSGTVRKASA